MRKTAIVLFLILSCVICKACGNKDIKPVNNGLSSAEDEKIMMGAERFSEYLPLLTNKKIGICANQTSRIGKTHLVDTLISLGVNVVKIYCPEHGFRGEAEAGALISSSTDTKTGLPIISLYGNNKKPTPEQMKGIDILIFDIQDVGCRFYTYISTLHYIMESGAENNVEIMVFDRPNPNGYFVDGPVLDMKYKSFVGMHPVPVVHGMTIGEYARMINGEGWLSNKAKAQLHIVTMENYTHNSRYSLPYPPSPNLQTDEAIYLYPSLCFFEGTAVSLGRGTPLPFQVYGHPSLTDGDYYFTPVPIKGISENPPQKGKKCRGYNLTEEANKNLSGSNRVSLSYLINAYTHFPKNETFFTSPDFFDKLAGTHNLREQITRNVPEEAIYQSWQSGLDKFKVTRKQYLLYPDFE